MAVKSSDLANDQGKFIQDSLIERSEQIHKLPQMCDPVTIPDGNGKTAYFIRYNRTDVPVDKLSEGVTPSETPFTITQQSVTVDEWGLYITLTKVGLLTTKHPVLNEALELIADAIARCQDYGIAEVLNDGTNTQFWDGTRASRAAITSTDVFKKEVVLKAVTGMADAGAPPPSMGGNYIAVCSPQIMADMLNESAAVGSFGAAAQQQDLEALKKGFVKSWLGVDWVKSNFLPKFTRIATVSAPTAGAGGSLSGTVYHKVTRKSLTRGFEEDIQVEANTAMGGNNRLTFTAPSTSGYVYNIYAGTATGDANLFLAKENLGAGQTYNLDSVPSSGDTAPATPAASITIHPIYLFGKSAVNNVDLAGGRMTGGVTKQERTDSDPLAQRRKVSASYISKAGIRDSDRMKRIELVSNF